MTVILADVYDFSPKFLKPVCGTHRFQYAMFTRIPPPEQPEHTDHVYEV